MHRQEKLWIDQFSGVSCNIIEFRDFFSFNEKQQPKKLLNWNSRLICHYQRFSCIKLIKITNIETVIDHICVAILGTQIDGLLSNRKPISSLEANLDHFCFENEGRDYISNLFEFQGLSFQRNTC